MKYLMKLKYLYAALLILCSSSCKKFLDQEPLSSAADQTTWKSDDDANSAVAACYSLTRAAMDASVSYYAYGDLPTDYFSNVLDYDLLQIHNINWAISVSGLSTYDPKLKLRVYTPYYSAVQQSNRCLHFLQAMPLSSFQNNAGKDLTTRKNQYMGEAYFMRAFNYFMMARIWGDLPLDTSYQSDISATRGQARTPQTQVLAACLSDLGYAKQFLSWKDDASADKVVRADKGTVFALMAHVYAWKGSYDSCRMACDSVIQSGSYNLVSGDNYPTLYNGQSEESIFEIAQSRTSEAMNATAYTASIANYTLCAPLLPLYNQPNWQIDEGILNQLFTDTNDIRYKKEFTVINTGSQDFYSCIKYSHLQTVTTSNAGNYYLLLNNIVVFRLADIMLLKAEALAAQPSPDYGGALDLVNQVRARANAAALDPITGRTELLDAVTDERGRELFLEGHRYYDQVRNTRLTGVSHFPNISQAEFTAGKYYWPLDPSLFTLNPLLTQTPFWAQLLTH